MTEGTRPIPPWAAGVEGEEDDLQVGDSRDDAISRAMEVHAEWVDTGHRSSSPVKVWVFYGIGPCSGAAEDCECGIPHDDQAWSLMSSYKTETVLVKVWVSADDGLATWEEA